MTECNCHLETGECQGPVGCKAIAEIERLRAAGEELCGALDDVLLWYSSGFAPDSQAKAAARARSAKAAFKIINQQKTPEPDYSKESGYVPAPDPGRVDRD